MLPLFPPPAMEMGICFPLLFFQWKHVNLFKKSYSMHKGYLLVNVFIVCVCVCLCGCSDGGSKLRRANWHTGGQTISLEFSSILAPHEVSSD